MKSRKIIYSDQAMNDLLEIELWLEAQAGPYRARRYVDRIVDTCEKLDLASHRGSDRSDILAGLRTIGFERRITIAFAVDDKSVLIIRVFNFGRDWEPVFSEN